MNKTVIGAIIGVVVIGAVVIFILNQNDDTSATQLQNNDPGSTVSRPAVQPVPNTFSIMTPEEKAAAEEAARLRAEAEVNASTTATSSDEDTPEQQESEGDAQLNTN